MKEHCSENPRVLAPGMDRRSFLTSVGVSAAAAAAMGGLSAEASPAAQLMAPGEMAQVMLRINGREHRLLVEPRWSLMYVLRERLGLTGTHCWGWLRSEAFMPQVL